MYWESQRVCLRRIRLANNKPFHLYKAPHSGSFGNKVANVITVSAPGLSVTSQEAFQAHSEQGRLKSPTLQEPITCRSNVPRLTFKSLFSPDNVPRDHVRRRRVLPAAVRHWRPPCLSSHRISSAIEIVFKIKNCTHHRKHGRFSPPRGERS